LILIPIVSINKGYIERSRSFVIELHTPISLGTNYSFLSGHSILITADSTSTVVLFKGNTYTRDLPLLLVLILAQYAFQEFILEFIIFFHYGN
jgi:hypothetical protein